MNEDTKVYVGLDVHKASIAIAQAAPGRGRRGWWVRSRTT